MTWGTQGLTVGAGGGFLKALSGSAGPAAGDRLRRSLDPNPPGARRSGSSLVEQSAHLFAARQRSAVSGRAARSAATGGPGATTGTDRGGGAGDVNPDHPRPGDPPIIRRSTWPGVVRRDPSAVADIGGSAGVLSAEQLARLVDAIEQRIIDELERRGRRHYPGVF
jgi:hypothetical protein